MTSKPWVEKYRPKRLEDVAYQKVALTMLDAALKQHTLPHLLFFGPPGTGKTSVAWAVARRLFGSSFRERVMELNASDDRGIDVVREKIKVRASRQVSTTEDAPDFQLIVLDEADCMTSDAQKALLRTMEVYCHSTRFVIICNYVSRMIAPLVSRCARIQFRPLPIEAMRQRMDAVCDAEEVQLEIGAFETLAKAAKGDLRRAIMLLQSAVRFGGNNVSVETVLEASGHIPESVIEAFETSSIQGPSSSCAAVMDIVNNGYSAQQFLRQFSERLMVNNHYSAAQKARIFEVVAGVDHKLSSGSSEALQLMRVGSILSELSENMMMD